MLRIHYGGERYDAPDLELLDISNQIHAALAKEGGLLPFETSDGTKVVILITSAIPIALEEVHPTGD